MSLHRPCEDTPRQRPLRRMYAPRSGVFASLSASELERLKTLGSLVSVERQMAVFHQGEVSNYVYLLVDGRMRVVVPSTSGHQFTARILYPGEILGVSSAVMRTPYDVSAVALTSSILQRIHIDAFMNFIGEGSQAIACVTRALAEEYLDLLEHAYLSRLSGDLRERVARVLLQSLPDGKEQPPLLSSITQEELGELVDADCAGVSGIIDSLKKARYIDVRDRSLIVINPEALFTMTGLQKTKREMKSLIQAR